MLIKSLDICRENANPFRVSHLKPGKRKKDNPQTTQEDNVSQIKTHDKCKYFSYKKCPHKDDEIMKQATQDFPEYLGGEPTTTSFPTNKEIDEICDKCDMFAQK